METLLTLTVKSTHFYLIGAPGGRLLVDAGWAGSLPAFQAELKRAGARLAEIRWVMFTHNHPDHAGLVQEVIEASGAKLIIHEAQIPYLPEMEAFHRGKGLAFRTIRVRPGDIVLRRENRSALAGLGFAGEVVETPGHSPDSVTLVLETGRAFTGDLTLPGMAAPENAEPIHASWQRLLALGAREFYPAHGSRMPAEAITRLLDENAV